MTTIFSKQKKLHYLSKVEISPRRSDEKLLFALGLLLLLQCKALNAGVLVEPYLGFGLGTQESSPSELSYDEDLSHLDGGIRLGYKNYGFFGGFEYNSTLSGDTDVPGYSDYTGTALGIFAGHEFPILFRVYAGYSLDADSELEATAGDLELDGNGHYVAGDVTALPFISINLEYHRNSFDESTGVGAIGSLNDTDESYVLLSVSLPLEFSLY